VLDWEMAGFGPREIDLAWFIFLHRFFEDLTAQYGMPGMPEFLQRDRVAAEYERVSGHTPRDLDFFTMYAALRHGIVMSRVQRRAIHFGEAEMPADIDDLIMHKATLEAMVAGSYWT
jgi:aminoglycoside phosphotransferase (APT) family kinase protein